MNLPVLYSFRRCPYAMRARIAISYSKISYEHREILLSNRPESLYNISSKGTVPVLKLNGESIIDESLDIMKWALSKNDPDSLYKNNIRLQDSLIQINDNIFKKQLDKYKYHTRHIELTYKEHQKNISSILSEYDKTLGSQKYLIDNNISLADIAIFPFVRQCAYVDLLWFKAHYLLLNKWLENFKNSNLFERVMIKYPLWKEGHNGVMVKIN